MITKNWDVIVAGGGIAGLITTILLANLKLKVLCIEPAKPAVKKANKSSDLRSTAYLLKSIGLLKKAKVWENLQPNAEALKIMQICDAGGSNGELRQISSFNSHDINEICFGYNISNWLVKKSLVSVIEKLEFSNIHFGEKVVELSNQTEKSFIRLSDGTQLSAKLTIAADGKNSDLRYLSKIKSKKWDNGQDALAFTTLHEKPHEGKSIEILESGGPCTLVPMQQTKNGMFQSAVVWMEKRKTAKSLLELSKEDFSKKLTNRTKHILGNCKLNSRRVIYPIITQLAERFYSERLALIAETAHVMPPIGAQGLNTSFEDIALLTSLIEDSLHKNEDFGSSKLLRCYGNRRSIITKSKMLGISLLNRTSKSNTQIEKDLRNLGLNIINKNSFLKNLLMRTGLGII